MPGFTLLNSVRDGKGMGGKREVGNGKEEKVGEEGGEEGRNDRDLDPQYRRQCCPWAHDLSSLTQSFWIHTNAKKNFSLRSFFNSKPRNRIRAFEFAVVKKLRFYHSMIAVRSQLRRSTVNTRDLEKCLTPPSPCGGISLVVPLHEMDELKLDIGH